MSNQANSLGGAASLEELLRALEQDDRSILETLDDSYGVAAPVRQDFRLGWAWNCCEQERLMPLWVLRWESLELVKVTARQWRAALSGQKVIVQGPPPWNTDIPGDCAPGVDK